MPTLNDYTKDELLALASDFGVEVKAAMNKAAIVAEFENDGVTFELIRSVAQAADNAEDDAPVAEVEVEEVAPEAEDDEDLVLVRMVRANASYQIRGYNFNQVHPYALVKEKDADFLIEVDGGFRMASPKEAREFYS